MEDTNKYIVLENGEEFALVKVDGNTRFGKKTIFSLAKTFRINPKTRKIHKIYKSNHELGIELFKIYLDKNPQEIIANQNISKPALIDFFNAAHIYPITKSSFEEMSTLIKGLWFDKKE